MTPRKPQGRRQNNNQQRPIPVSDYESDIPYSIPSQSRDPAEINFTVLQRYVPSLTSILAIAASAALYILTPDSSPAGAEWKRAEIEGTLFVCALSPSPITNAERHCIVVLNRKGMDNLIIESGEIDNVEITEEFLLLKFMRGGEECIMGFYVQDGNVGRGEICGLIRRHWEISQQALSKGYGDEVFESIEPEVGDRPMGRRLSLTELFGRR